MATGACGINCDTCRLNLRGICSSCGSGTSETGRRKMGAQEHLLGAACPMLACAVLNHIDYCLRDCDAFPCENYSKGPYPFSDAYLNMHVRRRKEPLPARAPSGAAVDVPSEYWEMLRRKNLQSVCKAAEATPDATDGLVLKIFTEDIRVDLIQRCLQRKKADTWEPFSDSFLELLTLLYLLNVKTDGILQEMVSVHDLKSAHFFQGPHALKKKTLLARFGGKPADLKKAGLQYGASILDLADAAICLTPFPKIPLYYLLWAGDEEFSASLSILFDRSIEHHLSADAIWGIVTWVSDALVNTT